MGARWIANVDYNLPPRRSRLRIPFFSVGGATPLNRNVPPILGSWVPLDIPLEHSCIRLGYGDDARRNGPFVLQSLGRHGFARNGFTAQWGLGKKPTRLPLTRRVSMPSSRSDGKPKL